MRLLGQNLTSCLPDPAAPRRILALGLGNSLLGDDGLGVKAIELLEGRFSFSPNVQVMDGGTNGLELLGPITEVGFLIAVDAIRNGGLPGTLYRLPIEERMARVIFNDSLHQVSLLDVLAFARALGQMPQTVLIGMEPGDLSCPGEDLSPRVRCRLEELCTLVLAEVESAGGSYAPRDARRPL